MAIHLAAEVVLLSNIKCYFEAALYQILFHPSVSKGPHI